MKMRVIAIAVGVALACWGAAQSNPLIVNEVRATNGWKRRLKIEVESSAHVKVRGSEVLITGTNVNFTVAAEFPALTPEDPPGGPWTHHAIEFLELKIGGELIKRWTPGEVPRAGDPKETHIRGLQTYT
jgi:hypothetical protein